MTDTVLIELKSVAQLRGATFSSAEVIGIVNRAIAEIERLNARANETALAFSKHDDAHEQEVAQLKVALTECANRLERCAISRGNDPETAAATVARYRTLTNG